MSHRSAPDGGTELETLESIKERYGEAVFLPQAGVKDGMRRTSLEDAPACDAEQAYRPTMRPTTPRLTILDDGESLEGEVFRLREAVTVIGRSDGDIRIPHDALMSKRHAEVAREGKGPHARWLLRDLKSANHTFVSCSTSVLRPDRLIMLGSTRYRFRPPGGAVPESSLVGTSLADAPVERGGSWPALVPTTSQGAEGIIPLVGDSLTLGRAGLGNNIELDDPCIAARHAVITLQSTGQWQIKAMPSRNGVWVQVGAVQLVTRCRFQCGEQRFLFSP